MLKCKVCKSRLDKVGNVRLNAAPYVGNPLAAFLWTGSTKSQASLLCFLLAFAAALVLQNALGILAMLVFLGYHLLVINDPKQLYKCEKCSQVYVGDKLFQYQPNDDLYL